MYWDPAQSNYIPVEDTTTTAAVSNETLNTNTTANESNDKAEKVKNAQKVAKVCIEEFLFLF
jgi:hypothetical protein